nr:hypothetical protein [Tanacetum cinerariifolium]
FVVNISYATTNKAFYVLEDPSGLESLFNGTHKFLAPRHILISPKPRVHTRIELIDPVLLNSNREDDQDDLAKGSNLGLQSHWDTELLSIEPPVRNTISGTYVIVAQLFSTSDTLEEGIVQAGLGVAGLSYSGSGFHQSFLMSAFDAPAEGGRRGGYGGGDPKGVLVPQTNSCDHHDPYRSCLQTSVVKGFPSYQRLSSKSKFACTKMAILVKASSRRDLMLVSVVLYEGCDGGTSGVTVVIVGVVVAVVIIGNVVVINMESSLVEESSSQGLRKNNTDSLSIATGTPNDNPTNNSGNIKEEEEESSHFETKKRKMTSKVWDEFKKIKLPDGGQKAECHHFDQDSMSQVMPPALVDGRFDMMKMRQSMAHCILMHEHSFNIVEDDGFNMMQQRGMLQWECTSRAFIKNDCMKVYEIEKKKLKNYLKCINKITVTTDMWRLIKK